MFVNKTEIGKFKMIDNINRYNFCLVSVSKDFTKVELSETCLNGAANDFSVDHSSIKQEDILNIHEYLMVNNYIK